MDNDGTASSFLQGVPVTVEPTNPSPPPPRVLEISPCSSPRADLKESATVTPVLGLQTFASKSPDAGDRATGGRDNRRNPVADSPDLDVLALQPTKEPKGDRHSSRAEEPPGMPLQERLGSSSLPIDRGGGAAGAPFFSLSQRTSFQTADFSAATFSGFAAAPPLGSSEERNGMGKESSERDIGVPLSYLTNHIAQSYKRALLCRAAVGFVPFLLLFGIFVVGSIRVQRTFFAQWAVRSALLRRGFPNPPTELSQVREKLLAGARVYVPPTDSFAGIGDTGDIIDYWNFVLLPAVWNCETPDQRYSLVSPMGQRYGLGAMRVRTIRVTSRSCSVAESFYPSNETLFPRVCYGGVGEQEDKASPCPDVTNPLDPSSSLLTYVTCDDFWSVLLAREKTYHCGGLVVDIPFNVTCAEARQVMQALGNCPMVDSWATRLIDAHYFLYDASLDAYLSVHIFLEQLAAGSWVPQYRFRSFDMPEFSVFTIVVDIVLFGCVFVLWGLLLRQFVQAVKTKTILSWVTSFWNILELVTWTLFGVLFGFRVAWMVEGRSLESEIKLPMPSAFPTTLGYLEYLFSIQIILLAFTTFFTFLQLFKYAPISPQLELITESISDSKQSIFGILVLFCFVLLAYSITGWVLFGTGISDFRHLGVSMSTLLQVLVGNSDYAAMRQENRFLAGAYFWSFVILALFLLLNMIVGVLAASFSRRSKTFINTDISESLARYFSHWRALLQPRNVCRIVKSALRGRSETYQLKLVLEDLRSYVPQEHVVEVPSNGDSSVPELTQSPKKEDMPLESSPTNAATARPQDDTGERDYSDSTLNLAQFRRAIRYDVNETLGDYFFEYTWHDVILAYKDYLRKQSSQDEQNLGEMIESAVSSVVGTDLDKVDAIDALLKRITMRVDEALSALKSGSGRGSWTLPSSRGEPQPSTRLPWRATEASFKRR